MKSILRGVAFGLWIAGLVAMVDTPATAQAPDATLRSTPETVIWGYFSADLPPALTIKSGQTVKIDTVSHQGLLSKDDPATFFGSAGIPPDQVLQDAKDIYAKVSRVKGLSAHVLTGPINVEGAEPGDMLEVRLHKFDLRVPYGVNNSGPRTGVLPTFCRHRCRKSSSSTSRATSPCSPRDSGRRAADRGPGVRFDAGDLHRLRAGAAADRRRRSFCSRRWPWRWCSRC